jgi:hypothetical protein
MKEIYKWIPGYEDNYKVSNLGNIKSYKRKKEALLNPSTYNNGYKVVSLEGKRYLVHQLVAIAFLGHKPDGHNLVIDHVDGNCLNNNLKNLNITTQIKNVYKGKKGDFIKQANNRFKKQNKNIKMGVLESQIKKIISKKITENNISAYGLSKKGINNLTLDAILQIKSKKGKSYKISTLFEIMVALDITEINLSIKDYIEKRKETINNLSKEQIEILGL